MTRLIVIFIVVLWLFKACGQSPGRRNAPPPQAKVPTAPADTRSWGQVIGDAIGPILTAGLAEAIRDEVVKKFATQLNANQPLETKLLSAWFNWSLRLQQGAPAEKVEHFSETIFLLQPGGIAREAKSDLLKVGDKPYLRLTRIYAHVDRPIAILSGSCVIKGKLSQAEQVLVYGADGNWSPLSVKERTHGFDSEHEHRRFPVPIPLP